MAALTEFLKTTDEIVHSCVVFGDDTMLSVSQTLANSVISFSALKTEFTHAVETAERIYSASQVDKIEKTLSPCTEVPHLARLKHIALLSKKHNELGVELAAEFDSFLCNLFFLYDGG